VSAAITRQSKVFWIIAAKLTASVMRKIAKGLLQPCAKTPQNFLPEGAAMSNDEIVDLAKRHGIPNPARLRALLDLSRDDVEEQTIRLLSEPGNDLRRSYAENYKNSEGASRR
jgi:hypothetical protein